MIYGASAYGGSALGGIENTTLPVPGPQPGVITFPGAITVGSIIQRVQYNLFDATGIFFDHDQIFDSIQDAYDEVVIYTECIEATTNIPFSTDIYYDLYNIIPGFFRVTKLFNKATNRWLRCVDSRVLDKFRYDWEISSGTPWFAYIVNYQWLAFFPHYTNAANQSFDIFYKIGKDVLLDDNSIPQIPPPHDRVLEYYATADMLEGPAREFTKAMKYWDDYYEEREGLRTQTMGRMLPDKLWQYNDLDWPVSRTP